MCSEDLLAELSDVLARPRIQTSIPPDAASTLCQLYAQEALFFEPGPNPQVCRDPSDDYLLSLAVVAAADYLVTRDDDLLVLKRFGETEIVHPALFLKILSQQA